MRAASHDTLSFSWAARGLFAACALAASLSARDEALTAGEILERMREAYVSAPALTDSIHYVLTMANEEFEPHEGSVVLGPGGDFRARTVGAKTTVQALDGRLTVELAELRDVALAVDLGEDPLQTLRQAMGGRLEVVPPQIALRMSTHWSEALEALSMGFVTAGTPTALRTVTEDGRQVHELSFEQDEGSGRLKVRVDAETFLVLGCAAQGMKPSPLGGEFLMTVDLAFAPTVVESLEQPLAAVTAATFVSRHSELIRTYNRQHGFHPDVAVGQPAPGFELIDQEGATHRLSDYRGRFVVLDFWGIWCAPCVGSLPAAQAMHEALADRGVAILALNVKDQGNDDVEAFWSDKGLTFPTLHDAEDVAEAYGIKSYPSTVVIDREGYVVSAFAGPAHDAMHDLDGRLD